MSMDRGKLLFAAIAVVLAAVFVRLGFWQLDRLQERRAANDLRRERVALPPVEIGPATATLLPVDSVGWRRVEARGVYDFRREIVLRGRSHQGRPGVELLTPLRVGDGTAVLVLRGWLPAPDGLRAPLESGRPTPAADAEGDGGRDTVTVRGVAVPGPAASAPKDKGKEEGEAAGVEDDSAPVRFRMAGEEHAVLARADPRAAARALPYPVAPFYIHAQEPGPAGPELRPARPLETGSGPHLLYAIQWFSFALIAVGGAAAYVLRDRRTA